MIATRMVLELTHLDTILLFHRFYALLNDGIYHRWKMLDLLLAIFALHPFANIEVPWSVQWDWITVE